MKKWLKGLGAAVLGGTLMTVTGTLADPRADFKELGKIAVVGAALGAGAYLKQSPLEAKPKKKTK